MKVSLLGTGAYGIAMAMMLNKNNKDIIMWTESEKKLICMVQPHTYCDTVT